MQKKEDTKPRRNQKRTIRFREKVKEATGTSEPSVANNKLKDDTHKNCSIEDIIEVN